MNRRQEAYRFFRQHAGGVVGRNAVVAWQLTLAEEWAETHAVSYRWEEEEEKDLSWCDCGQCENHEVLYVVLEAACPGCDQPEVLASLGNIVDSSREYGRVIEAELACEAMGQLEGA
jgi:hypothetical protein